MAAVVAAAAAGDCTTVDLQAGMEVEADWNTGAVLLVLASEWVGQAEEEGPGQRNQRRHNAAAEECILGPQAEESILAMPADNGIVVVVLQAVEGQHKERALAEESDREVGHIPEAADADRLEAQEVGSMWELDTPAEEGCRS